jgi:transposase
MGLTSTPPAGLLRGEGFAQVGQERSGVESSYACSRRSSDWVHRYNATGIDGLKSYHGPGATPLVTEAEKAELKAFKAQNRDGPLKDQE